MTVAEYELKFTQLSVYAANLVSTEKEKCQKFEERLHYDIQNKLTPYDLEGFSRLMATAIRAEKLVNERKAFFAARAESSKKSGKRKEQSDTFSASKRRDNRGGFASPRKEGTGSSSYTRQGQRQTTEQRPQCLTCGRYHFGECRMMTGGCFRCSEKGHQIRDCSRRSDVSRAGTELTIQGSRASGTPTCRGRGQGQASSSAQHPG